MNPRLPGVSEMTKKLSCPDRSLKIVAIYDGDVGVTSEFQAQAILERPSGSVALSRQKWLNRMRKLLRDVFAAG